MGQKVSWMGIDIAPFDMATVFHRPSGQQALSERKLGPGWQWIGDTKYPDPYSTILLRRYPDRPFIIGFQRCGRHWMSLVLECYFQQPFVLEDTPWSDNSPMVWPRVLYEHNFPEEDYPATNFLVQYRKDPVAVVFSYTYRTFLGSFRPTYKYAGEIDFESSDFPLGRAKDYGEFLDKYLFQLKPKDFYTYEDMMQDMPSVLRKICSLVDEDFNEESCARVIREVTWDKCLDLMGRQVMFRIDEYEDLKREFYSRYADRIWDTVTLPGPHIKRMIERG